MLACLLVVGINVFFLVQLPAFLAAASLHYLFDSPFFHVARVFNSNQPRAKIHFIQGSEQRIFCVSGAFVAARSAAVVTRYMPSRLCVRWMDYALCLV